MAGREGALPLRSRETPPTFRKQDAGEEVFVRVVGEALEAVEASGIEYALVGGIASAIYARPRWTEDADFLVRPKDARAFLEVLSGAGFETDETDPAWLYKAGKDGVLIDVIFQSKGHIYLDDEMLARARREKFRGKPVRVASPEDLLIMKAVAHEEDSPRYWFDALSLLWMEHLDWDYLMSRSLRHGAQRILALLIYARSCDIHVPLDVVQRLHETVYEVRR